MEYAYDRRHKFDWTYYYYAEKAQIDDIRIVHRVMGDNTTRLLDSCILN